MNFWQLFFGFKGRIGRAAYWLASISIYVCLLIMEGLTNILKIQADNAQSIADDHTKLTSVILLLAMLLIVFVVMFALIWASLAVPVKRWHDRGKSGWWVLIGLIPIIGWIWTFVECGCLPGTLGANRYGDLAGGPVEVAATFS